MSCAITAEPPDVAMTDLLALTAEFVDIPSVSWNEQLIGDRIEAELRGAPWL